MDSRSDTSPMAGNPPVLSICDVPGPPENAEKKQAPRVEEVAYTSFSLSQRRQLQLLLGLATITSPLTSTIYFPLLPLLRIHFNTSAQAVNLSLTIYIIFQAISPAIFGPISDVHGRRPFFQLTLFLYLIGNIGLAVNRRSYAVVLVLRAVQSLGASAAYAISFGVVADICVPSDRGRMLGSISMALNLGACVGPIAGGLVAYTSGSFEWVFWALAIVGAALFTCVNLFLSETARMLVGNGCDQRRFMWWQLSWIRILQEYLSGKMHLYHQKGGGTATLPESIGPRTTWERNGITKFLTCFRIIFYKDAFFSLWIHGSFYTVDYSFVAAVPDIFKDIHGFNDLQLGLAYLPRGVGIIVGSFLTGRLMDHNYKRVAQQNGWTVDSVSGDDLLKFPIEEARSRYSYLILVISTTTMVGYGWAVQMEAHFGVLIALQFMQGFWGTYFYTTYSTLEVDSWPESPSTAAATTSITRCAMAAAGVAVLQPLLDASGHGWFFTSLGLWSGVFGAISVTLLRWRGMKWRNERASKKRQPG